MRHADMQLQLGPIVELLFAEFAGGRLAPVNPTQVRFQVTLLRGHVLAQRAGVALALVNGAHVSGQSPVRCRLVRADLTLVAQVLVGLDKVVAQCQFARGLNIYRAELSTVSTYL